MNSSTPTNRKGIDRWLRLRPGDAIIFAIILVVAAICLGYVWPFFREIRSFDSIEKRAQRKITARELQAWATNLLAHYPPGHYRAVALGTNFPKQLLGHWTVSPSVIVNESHSNSSGAVAPGWVYVAWSSGFMGQCGFEIGPTNFASYNSKSHAWSDGVYFRSK